VDARLFRQDEGESLTIAFLDRRKDRAALSLDVDCGKLDVDGLSRATLYTLDGHEVVVPLQARGEGCIRLDVPKREGVAAAIVITK